MNRDEFVATCAMRGLCYKRTAREYADKIGKEEFDEEDCENAYRYEQRLFDLDEHYDPFHPKNNKKYKDGAEEDD